jgi:uncharacterized protein YbdZ (MbtH family)
MAGKAGRVGLLATDSIRQGKNRVVLDRIHNDIDIFFAESSRDWILKGAAVKVSMVGFGKRGPGEPTLLDGVAVDEISPDLTSTVRAFSAKPLPENRGISFQGDKKDAPFEIPGEMARQWLDLPVNPNGHPNSDVLRPWANGEDITGRPSGKWIIDFGMPLKSGSEAVPGMNHLSETEASFYEAPFRYVVETVKPAREAAAVKSKGSAAHTVPWFCHARPRPEMRSALHGLPRFLATVIHAKHRLFVWLPEGLLPSHSLIVFATDQDAMFGLLHSRVHELWALVMGSALEDRPRYTPNTTFETFPFPAGWRVAGQDQANTDPEDHAFIGVHRCSSVANPSLPPVVENEKSKELENHRYTPMNTDKAKEHLPSAAVSPVESAANPFPAGWRVAGQDQANTDPEDHAFIGVHRCSSVADPSFPPVAANEKCEELENHRYTPMNTDKANEPLAPIEKLATKNTKATKEAFSVPFVPFVANPFLPSVAEAARLLHEARNRWLNPEGASEAELKKRTLTALYNDREAGRASWLNHLHRELDHAVLAAYGWSDLAEPLFAAEDALRAANPKGDALGLALGRTVAGQVLLGRLLALNLERAKKNNPPS